MTAAADELVLDRTLKRGLKGPEVRRVQEWLSLHGFQVTPDEDFGPATELAVQRFQEKAGLKADGIVGPKTFARLVAPMVRTTSRMGPGKRSLGRLVVAYAKRHLSEHPREVGGQNRGPWVRLYMDGHEGPEWPWCAGFACYVLKQACRAKAAEPPITPSFSCDSLAASAQQQGRFLAEGDAGARERVRRGCLFLKRRTPTDWEHAGIVVQPLEEVFETIEGNTNDDGSREGYEVCRRFRSYRSTDFVLI